MSHHFYKPIRTYGKQKYRAATIPLAKLGDPVSTEADYKRDISVESRIHAIEVNHDNSVYDPFETTFDRLAKNARIPPPAPKLPNDTESFNSSADSSMQRISQTKIDERISLLQELDDSNTKSSKRKAGCKKPGMQITKKTIAKKKKAVLHVSGKLKVHKDNSHAKCKVYKIRNRKNAKSDNLERETLSFISDAKPLEVKNHKGVKRKASNKKNSTKKSKKENDPPNAEYLSNMEVKTCFVMLDRRSISEWNNSRPQSVENNLSNGANKPSIKTEHLLNQDEVGEPGTCPFPKSLASCNKWSSVISSTPNGRPIRPSTHCIPLSPISLRHSEKLKCEVSLEHIQADDYSYKRMDTVEKQENEEICKAVSNTSCLINSSSFNKCNTSQTKSASKKDTDALPVCTLNFNDIKPEMETISKRESMDLMKDCYVLLQRYQSPHVEKKKQQLRFSLDTNRSQSLFDDTKQDTQSLLQKDTIENNLTKVSTVSDLILEEIDDLDRNETHAASAGSEKESTFSRNASKRIEVTFDETRKDVSKALSLSSLTKSDVSSDDIENKSVTEEYFGNNDRSINDRSPSNRKSTVLSMNNNSLMYSNKKNGLAPCYVVLNRLQNTVGITKRRMYTKWDCELHSILEDETQGTNDSPEPKRKRISSNESSTGRQTIVPRKTLMPLENIAEMSADNIIAVTERPIFLKPGKSWTRSLSILNNVQAKCNLDKLSIGKGKKWRHSVQDILDMQKNGIIQSCIKKNDSSKELHLHNETINKSDHERVSTKGRTCDSYNHGRVSRRISVRVVPIHETVKFIEDAPFLEVYGIVPARSQRLTLVNNPRKSSKCNIQTDDVDGVIAEEHIISTAKEVILQRCLQTDYIPFSAYFSDSYLEYCRKIGEGVYGEVFLYEQEDKRSVIKIIPIEGSECVNGEPQKKFHEILSEIVIAMELHNLRFNTKYNTDGFVEVKNIKCIKGRYPEKLIELWNIYDEEKRSDNDCPSMFTDDQLYIVLELGHGGQDLEAFVFNTAEEAHNSFVQAALALAVAEKAVQFEHRDLHWGNILIAPTDEPYIRYKIGPKNIELNSTGVKVSIIDFTLSRVTYQGCSVFNDLATDPTLFAAQGEYQFEIYRLMRDKVRNNWQTFEPYTNVLWLHYTLDKMITAVRYRRKNLKIHKNGIAKLNELRNEILEYSSAFDFVTNCDKIVKQFMH